MKIKTYRAATIKEALAEIKKELGPEAFILGQKDIQPKKGFGVFRKSCVEVTAAVDYTQDASAASTPASSAVSDSGDRVTLEHSMLPAPSKPDAEQSKREDKHALLDEIRELRAIVQSMAATPPVNRSTIVHTFRQFPSASCAEIHAELLYCGIEEPLAGHLVESAQAAQTDRSSDDKLALRNRILADLSARIRIEPGIISQATGNGPQIIALIGPTGVGKTTTVAKLAAKAALEYRLRVALVTNDTFRIAAAEQLKTYADIIGIPLRVTHDTTQLTQAIAEFANRDVVLTDTAGRSPREMSSHQQLAAFFSGSPKITKALVLSATTKQADLEDILQRYNVLDPSWMIFTKLDETEVHGSIVNGLVRSGKPLVYVTMGQGVPQDITQPSVSQIARLALGRGDFSVWTSFISEARSTAYENVAGFDYPQLLQRDLQVVR